MLRVDKVEEENKRINEINHALKTKQLSDSNVNINAMKVLEASANVEEISFSNLE